jgi:hypothetical protein
VSKPTVVMGDYFVNLSNFHVKDEKQYGTTRHFNFIDQLMNGNKVKERNICNLLHYGTLETRSLND